MNSTPHNSIDSGSALGPGEETLRLIAGLPAPAGLEDRVHAALRAAPRRGRLLAWPTRTRSITVFQSNWMRSAAAAAIVFVVAGGGWGVYKHVEQTEPAKVVAMPARVPGAGGLSSAGAVRTPETIPGPAVNRPSKAGPVQAKHAKKPAARTTPAAKGQLTPAGAPEVQPATSK
ncbi:MAG: hypothetical protein ABSF23_04770 [Terracidiphilus sp.]|jgi:hypothetical protein